MNGALRVCPGEVFVGVPFIRRTGTADAFVTRYNVIGHAQRDHRIVESPPCRYLRKASGALGPNCTVICEGDRNGRASTLRIRSQWDFQVEIAIRHANPPVLYRQSGQERRNP